jgi:hypothetical protein
MTKRSALLGVGMEENSLPKTGRNFSRMLTRTARHRHSAIREINARREIGIASTVRGLSMRRYF